MSLLFWRKTQDTGEYRIDGKAHPQAVPVTEDDPLPTRLIQPDEDAPISVKVEGGDTHLGQVGGHTTVISQTPTLQVAGAYTAKDAVGGLLTFDDAARAGIGTGVIQSVVIVDDDAEAAALVLVLYGAPFTPTADADAFDPSDADNENLIGHIPIATTDYQALNDNAVATKSGIALPFELAPGTTKIYGQLMCTGTPTYTAATDLTVKLGVFKD